MVISSAKQHIVNGSSFHGASESRSSSTRQMRTSSGLPAAASGSTSRSPSAPRGEPGTWALSKLCSSRKASSSASCSCASYTREVNSLHCVDCILPPKISTEDVASCTQNLIRRMPEQQLKVELQHVLCGYCVTSEVQELVAVL